MMLHNNGWLFVVKGRFYRVNRPTMTIIVSRNTLTVQWYFMQALISSSLVIWLLVLLTFYNQRVSSTEECGKVATKLERSLHEVGVAEVDITKIWPVTKLVLTPPPSFPNFGNVFHCNTFLKLGDPGWTSSGASQPSLASSPVCLWQILLWGNCCFK